MKVRYVRSPYIIDINEPSQLGSKLELFIWNKGTSMPTSPTYNFSKAIVSTTQRAHSYNISNYVREFITNISPIPTTTFSEEDFNNMWCFFKVKRYKLIDSTYVLLTSDTELDDVIQVAVNGFSLYQDGVNKQNTLPIFLFDTNIKLSYSLYQTPYYINFLTDYIDTEHTVTYKNKDNITLYSTSFTPTTISNYKINIGVVGTDTRKVQISINGVATVFEFLTEGIEECKYSPVICSFINSKGGWQPLTFYKQQTINITTTSNQYRMFQTGTNYNVSIGQYSSMNTTGKKTIKLNTGWVSQDYQNLIQDLLLSETILLDGLPAMVKTKSIELKTHLKDKLINYEIEFDYSFDIINNMV